MPRGPILKCYDLGPAAVTTAGVYSGGTTGFASGIADGNANALYWLTDLAQSDDDNGRVGQSIAIETLEFRCHINWDLTAAVGVTQALRMIMFADNENPGAAPAIGDLLLQGTVATGAVQSFLNPSNFGRFKIIEDKIFHNTQNGGISNSQESRATVHEAHHDLKGWRVMWDSTDGDVIQDARKGHIFLFWIYEQRTVAAGGIITIGTANPPGIQLSSRLRYRDA